MKRRARAAGSRGAVAALKVEVAHPVDDVEQQEGGGEEDARVRVQLLEVYVDAAFPPRASFALLEAAEEALAVFAVQTLVDTRVLKVLPVHGVVQRDDGVRRPHVQHGIVLTGRGGRSYETYQTFSFHSSHQRISIMLVLLYLQVLLI